MANWISNYERQRTQLDQQYSVLAQTARGKDVRQMLESHPSIQATTGKLWLNNRGIYHPLNAVIDDLTCWYLWFEDQYGSVAATDALNRYLECETVKTTYSIWVFGIKPEKIYRFSEGISLVPVEDMPNSREREEYLALIRNYESPVSYAAFTREVAIPRLTVDESDAQNIHQRLIQPSHELLQGAVALINGIGDLSCLPHWLCKYQDENIPLGGIWNMRGKTSQNFDVMGTHSRTFLDVHAEKLGKMLKSFQNLAAEEKTKQWLYVILDRLRKSKRQRNIEDKILDLGIAVEMLLLKDLGERDPISLPFRLRGSWLLGHDFQRRKEVYATLKDLYTYRCQIAHDGSFKKEKDFQAASQKLPDFYDIAEQILNLTLSPNYPKDSSDWNDLCLGKRIDLLHESKNTT